MQFDDNIWYAVNQTRILFEPTNVIETFGQTKIRYRIACEVEDKMNLCKIHEGIIQTEKPIIISPTQYITQITEGFGEKAQEYADWLGKHGSLIKILQYGLQISKEEISESEVHESLDTVSSKLIDLAKKETSPSTVIQGVENMWEVSLLKFMQGYMQRSAPINFESIQAHQSNAASQIKRDQDSFIEEQFFNARGQKDKILDLGKQLQQLARFNEFEDRFYALLREC
jgi:hypothetical protein